jgi:DNA-binding NtrC family response regulator
VLISNYHIRERSANPLPFADQIVVMETVLVVEDEVLIWSSISEYLRRCSYRVFEAADAGKALIVCRSRHLKLTCS